MHTNIGLPDRLRIALKGAQFGSWRLDLASGLLESSPRWREICGFADDKTRKRQDLLDIIHQDDRGFVREAWDRALRDGSDYQAEYRIRRPGGAWAWVLDSGHVFQQEGAEPPRMIGVTLEIIGQDQQEEVRRAAEDHLTFALSGGSGVGTWDWDIAADLVYADERFASLFSVDPKEAAKGAPIADFIKAIHPGDRERVAKRIEQAIADGEEYGEEYRLVQKDGSVRWVHAVGRCRRGSTGVPLRFPGVVFDTTELKREAQQTRESKERLQAIFDGTHEFIGLLTPEGRVLEANRASLRFARISRENVLGQLFWQAPWFAYTAGAPALVEEWVRQAAAGRSTRHELALNGPAGESVTLDLFLHPIRNDRGEVILIVPEGRDITETKIAELRDAFLVRLDDSTRPLNNAHAIVETAARLLCEYLHADRCVYGEVEPDKETVTLMGGYAAESPALAGRFYLARFGREVLESMRSNRPLVVGDVDTDGRFPDAGDLYRQGSIRAFCAMPLHKDGRLAATLVVDQQTPRAWLASEIEVMRIAANRCWESIERARVTRELKQQWHYFDAVLSNTPDLTYSFDLRGRFTYGNRALLSLLQLPLTELLGKNFHELNYPPELAGRLQKEIQLVIDTRETFRNQTPFSGPTGEIRQYEYIFVPVLAADGSVEAVAGSTRDITERKQAEEQEKEREEQLRESARLESLGVMAGGIAHDFNNLLTGILGNACLLAGDFQDGDGAIARQIVIAAERAADLTRQMLAFSGKGRFIVERIDLNALVRENLILLHASLSKNVSVKLELSDEPFFVEADPSQIQQIVMNLLINASEAVGELPGTVKVRTATTTRTVKLFSPFLQTAVPPGRYVQLEISDNGSGMSPETLKKIFDPFFTTKFTGRGLGLAAVLGIVKGHQGDLEVVTQLGCGTTFRVLLPFSERGEIPVAPAETKAFAAGTSQTILVVDDEEIVRKVAATALSRRGYRVLLANHGEEALETLRQNPDIALVILDLTMPVMTGEQAIPLIKQMRPGLPIVLSSGFNEAEVSHRFASAGISGFLQKPYAASAILMIAGELLNTKKDGSVRAKGL